MPASAVGRTRKTSGAAARTVTARADGLVCYDAAETPEALLDPLRTSCSIVIPRALQMLAIVKNSGDGLRPVSILRRVSTET